MRELYEREKDYDYIMAKVAAGLDPEEVADDVEKRLRKDHGLKEGNEDF